MIFFENKYTCKSEDEDQRITQVTNTLDKTTETYCDGLGIKPNAFIKNIPKHTYYMLFKKMVKKNSSFSFYNLDFFQRFKAQQTVSLSINFHTSILTWLTIRPIIIVIS